MDSIDFAVSKTTFTIMIKEVPMKESLVILNIPLKMIGSNAMMVKPTAPIMIMVIEHVV